MNLTSTATKVPCAPAGAAHCPGVGGYRYDDTKDAVNEGSRTVHSGLGRIVALHHHASASYQIHSENRCLYF
jgi:hypothetical protein